MEENIAYNRATDELKNGLYQEACNYYEQAINADPENSLNNHDEIYNNWGNALANLALQENNEKLFEASLEKYKKATELNPSSFAAYYNWGITLSDLARLENNKTLYESSIEKYKKATELEYKDSIELNPNDYKAYNKWGDALSYLAKKENNKELYESSIEKYKKARELKHKNNIKLYKEAIELDPNHVEAYYFWGDALYCLAKEENNKELYEASIEKYKKATELDPDYVEAYNNCGCALIELAKLDNNIAKYKNDIFEVLLKVEKLDEGSGAFNLACLHSLLNEKDMAFDYLNAAFRLGDIPDRDYIENDTDFDNLKFDPRFEELLNKYFPKGKS